MQQLQFLLTTKYSKQPLERKWWATLTENQRWFHKVQHFGFYRKNGQCPIASERDIARRSYEEYCKVSSEKEGEL